ncbi:VOC family protein [Sphingomonas sp. PAMC 26621]|uniref:VOC family protein n=1 Tax=Sphingomonas sp. PAMC 26621 TaxID=1112213 RepID=UPI001EE643E8|nr:VOC family protein [Sphingomonas sp. PAMC 26621]
MPSRRRLSCLVAAWAVLTPMSLAAEPSGGKITGVGGVFVKSKDPQALMAWYRDVLGLSIESWGGAMLPYDAPNHPPALILNVFKDTSDYMAPSRRDFMLNFAVDDLSAFIDRLKAKGVAILKRDDSDASGKFAWIVDPDGTKIELWEPKAGALRTRPFRQT